MNARIQAPDCPADARKKLASFVELARRYVAAADDEVRAIAGLGARERRARWDGGRAASASLRDWFGPYSEARLRFVARVFAEARRRLHQGFDFAGQREAMKIKCLSAVGTRCEKRRLLLANASEFGTIRVCPRLLTKPLEEGAMTMLHESLHQFAGVDDQRAKVCSVGGETRCYRDGARALVRAGKFSKALKNNDNYVSFARALHDGRAASAGRKTRGRMTRSNSAHSEQHEAIDETQDAAPGSCGCKGTCGCRQGGKAGCACARGCRCARCRGLRPQVRAARYEGAEGHDLASTFLGDEAMSNEALDAEACGHESSDHEALEDGEALDADDEVSDDEALDADDEALDEEALDADDEALDDDADDVTVWDAFGANDADDEAFDDDAFDDEAFDDEALDADDGADEAFGADDEALADEAFSVDDEAFDANETFDADNETFDDEAFDVDDEALENDDEALDDADEAFDNDEALDDDEVFRSLDEYASDNESDTETLDEDFGVDSEIFDEYDLRGSFDDAAMVACENFDKADKKYFSNGELPPECAQSVIRVIVRRHRNGKRPWSDTEMPGKLCRAVALARKWANHAKKVFDRIWEQKKFWKMKREWLECDAIRRYLGGRNLSREAIRKSRLRVTRIQKKLSLWGVRFYVIHHELGWRSYKCSNFKGEPHLAYSSPSAGVKLCPGFFSLSNDDMRAQTIVHELFHTLGWGIHYRIPGGERVANGHLIVPFTGFEIGAKRAEDLATRRPWRARRNAANYEVLLKKLYNQCL